jgi:hypothetical protein
VELELENGSVTGPLRVVKGATVDALIGTNVLSGSSGHQIVNAGIMEVESGALLTLAGIVNSGTLMINGDEIQFVGPISGGTTVIGNGVLSIQHSSSENVTFLSAGTGALVLDANYTGKVTSFGGNISQLIEFVLVASAGATVIYTSKSTDSGILDVISGGHTVATVNMVGHYTTADFHTSSFLGALTVTDPEVVEQKSGNASATIASGTVLEVNVPDSGKVTFAGPNGTLWLDKPSTFTGKLADYCAGQHRPAEHPVRRPHDAGLLRGQQRHRRYFVGQERTPHHEHRAPRHLHRRELRCCCRRPRRHARHRGAAARADAIGASASVMLSPSV